MNEDTCLGTALQVVIQGGLFPEIASQQVHVKRAFKPWTMEAVQLGALAVAKIHPKHATGIGIPGVDQQGSS